MAAAERRGENRGGREEGGEVESALGSRGERGLCSLNLGSSAESRSGATDLQRGGVPCSTGERQQPGGEGEAASAHVCSGAGLVRSGRWPCWLCEVDTSGDELGYGGTCSS